MKIFKAEQWNIEVLAPLFEAYRLANGMSENPDRTLTFLTNRIRFNESMFFVAINENAQAIGFVQLYPRLSSLQLQRYWQLTDIFVKEDKHQAEVYAALISKAKEFVRYTQSNRLVAELSQAQQNILEREGFKLNTKKSLFELTLYWVKLLEVKEYEILTDIEIPLAYVLAQMESNGVSIDKKYLDELTNEFNTKTSTIASRIFELAGEEFNINSPKQVGNILFDKMQLKSKKKRGKAKNSTSAEVLTALADEYEIAKLILDYRKYAKLKSTYTEALPALVSPIDGRIHTSYNQTVTTTGRLSSSNPNLQNIPIRTEEGNKIRQAFVPSDRANYLIMSADYSQIELRLLAHVSEDEHLIEAFNSGIDVHTLTASKVFEVPIEEVTKEMRYKAKAVNFGIVYGQSKYGLAKALKITPAEAENFINKYFETYPKINEYMSKMVELVEKQGYVETIFGRRRYLDNEINSPNAMIREFAKRAAINHPMQGSASDLIKLAMIDFSKRLKDNNLKSKLIIQVHDELVIETAKDELEQVKSLVLESMELEQPLRVPLLIDVNVGESWKES